MTDFTTDKPSRTILAMIKAGQQVRGGEWINGSHSYIFAEF